MPAMSTVTFYTKPDCGLCAKAEVVLRRVRAAVPFTWITVDITRDEEAFRRFWAEVPVVEIDGVVRFRGAVEPERLRALLEGNGCAS